MDLDVGYPTHVWFPHTHGDLWSQVYTLLSQQSLGIVNLKKSFRNKFYQFFLMSIFNQETVAANFLNLNSSSGHTAPLFFHIIIFKRAIRTRKKGTSQ